MLGKLAVEGDFNAFSTTFCDMTKAMIVSEQALASFSSGEAQPEIMIANTLIAKNCLIPSLPNR